MKRIFIPTQAASDWQRLLAKPKLHWKKAHSAMTTAACWEAVNGNLPAEISSIFDMSNEPSLANLQLLAAFPEWEVPLPGGDRSSFTDVLALARNAVGLVAIAVEAKVDEEFGPTLLSKRAEASVGQNERIDYLHKVLRLKASLPDTIRYGSPPLLTSSTSWVSRGLASAIPIDFIFPMLSPLMSILT